ncbi:leucine-rich repeat-containing 15-like isoform X2 [Paramuricea clavata]|uniref:Leucine-rich repeat-containing 15-like isoform X2 n=1 Tax=Paramuricea clavata TaxID=317549 RepID=A0A6S7II18_PARCT|nr:leucine-rich repeat-containing 15-like isoform X2 [Paramuricea clavata]
MAEPFSQENVKDSILPPHQILSPWKSKTDYSLDYSKEFLDLSNKEKESKTDYSLDCSQEFLDLSNKDLSLSDISSILRSRTYFKQLDLSGCGLTELPDGLEYSYELKEVNLSNNPLRHLFLISSLDRKLWRGLKKLDLSGCGLAFLPEGLQFCHELEELDLSNNPLRHLILIPSLDCKLWWRGLKKLDLSGCGLTKLFGGFQFCQELDLSNNPLIHLFLISSLDCKLWRGLKKLNLSGCGLTEVPEGLQCCHELEELNLSNNPLRYLYLSYIPHPEYKIWRRLKKLDMSDCDLVDWPNCVQEYGNLQELNLSKNSFDHQDLLEKLNSGKVFSYSSFHKIGKELLKPAASGSRYPNLTRIIFEDAVYTQSSGG